MNMKAKIAFLLVLALCISLSAAATSLRNAKPNEPVPVDNLGDELLCEASPDVDTAPVKPAALPFSGAAGLLPFLILLLPLAGLCYLVLRRRGATWQPALATSLALVAIIAGTLVVGAHVLQTTQGNPITHTHPTGEFTPEQQETLREVAGLVPGTRTEEQPPSPQYDCHGKTFDGTGSWINNDQVEQILNDDGYNEVPAGGARLGDVVVYRNGGSVTHSGIVTGIDSDGNVTEVCSKWGKGADYRHKPGEVPQGESGNVGGQPVTVPTYGTPTVYRQ